MTGEKSLNAYLALAFAVAILGIAPLLIRWADAPATVIAFYRMAIASVILAWPFYFSVRKSSRLSRRSIGLAALSGLVFGVNIAVYAAGIHLDGATIPTLLGNLTPIWVGLGMVVFLREKLPSKFWWGLSLALTGAALVMELNNFQHTPLGWGSVYGLLAGVLYAVYLTISKRALQTLSPLDCLWIASTSAAAFLLVANLVLAQPLTG